MTLEDLLRYENIVIQCHDDPDADAIASGYALLKYLQSKGEVPPAGIQRRTEGHEKQSAFDD